MAQTNTTTTVEMPVEELNALISAKLFGGRDIHIRYVISEVGADPMDQFRGHDEVTSVQITYDGAPAGGIL